MKTLFLTLFVSTNLFAGSLSVISPCEQTTAVFHSYNFDGVSNVGQQSVEILTKLKIPFQGSFRGMNTILNTPLGLDALEVISDTEMNAYGWCYSVNGFEPGEFSDQVTITQEDDIIWWYGFAKYKDGNWITQCTPSYERNTSLFCSQFQ